MFNLRRCCIGAALGLSLLACRPAYANNQFTDPGFEATSISAWKFSHGASWKTTTVLGTAGKAHSGHGYVSFGTTGIGIVTQPVSLVAGSPYRISGWMAGTGGILAGFLSKTYASGVTGPTVGHMTNSGSKYQSFHFDFTAKSSYHNVAIEGSQIRLDDVSLSPRPASAPEIDSAAGAPALALALGGLALMERRRRSPTPNEVANR